MASFSRSPLFSAVLMIGAIALLVGGIATTVLILRPQTVDPRGRAAPQQAQISNLPSPWRAEGSGIFRYDNGVFLIGLPAGSEPAQPLFWRNLSGDFTLQFRLAQVRPAGTNFPSPMISFGDPNLPDQGVSVRLLYLSGSNPDGENRMSVGRIALYTGQQAVGEPTRTATLTTPEQILVAPNPIVWLRFSVTGATAQVEYSLTGESWFVLGQVNLPPGPGRLSIGMFKISATPELGPSILFDNLTLQEF